MLMHETNMTKYTCKLNASFHKINVTKERSCYKYNKPLRTVCYANFSIKTSND